MSSDTTRPDATFGPVSGDDMAEWCAALRDDNAIHLSRAAAEAAGFGPNRVNPGPANLAYVLSAAMTRDPQAEFAQVTARFLGNVLEDDMLSIQISDETAELRATTRDVAVLAVQITQKERP